MKKIRKEPVMVKGLSFAEMMEEVQKKGLECKKKLEENEGRCIKCNKNMANPNSHINQFCCDECNKETEELLKQLRGPGFSEFKIHI